MDLYRMRKAGSFRVCLLLVFLLALSATPLEALLLSLARLFTADGSGMEESAKLSDFLGSPLSSLNAMLTLLSICGFFYADVENGYVKNIAGQMPKRGYTVLSKFLASIPHNLVFVAVAIVGGILGTLPFQRITMDGAVLESLWILVLKLLLLEGICAILLLFTASLRSKSLGTVFAVLFGTGILVLAYMGIDAGLNQILPKKRFSVADYMPDQLFRDSRPDTVAALLVSAVTICLFLWLAIRIFDRKDVK
jgi:hypothetical protein